MRIYLVGYMASGKTTIGKKLAKALGYKFLDLDSEIARIEGVSAGAIIQNKGEDFFRKVEADVLRNTASLTQTVVATGGGAPLHFNGMQWMRGHGIVVYLKADPAFIISRLGDQQRADRPLVQRKSDEGIALHMAERQHVYAQAHMVLEVPKGNWHSLLEMISNYLNTP